MSLAGQHDRVDMPSAPAVPPQPVGGALKRAVDIVVALTALVLLAPLLAIVALILLKSRGRPILCRNPRVGFGGRIISCYCFCTLGSDGHPTPFGAVLMRSGIAKLPQLINVLKGEMSCVGPRPQVADELQEGEAGPYLCARPGLTGTWQLTLDTPSRAEAAALDSAYVRNWSVLSDLTILLKSILAVVRVEERA